MSCRLVQHLALRNQTQNGIPKHCVFFVFDLSWDEVSFSSSLATSHSFSVFFSTKKWPKKHVEKQRLLRFICRSKKRPELIALRKLWALELPTSAPFFGAWCNGALRLGATGSVMSHGFSVANVFHISKTKDTGESPRFFFLAQWQASPTTVKHSKNTCGRFWL